MSDKIAVLIDSDNAQPCKVKLVLAEVAKYGTACVKRAYGDWTETSLGGWKGQLLKNSIQPIQQFAYTRGKNSTDAAMVIDAMDLLHSRQLDAFCLVSSDSDFTRLASRIRESGLTVYGCGERKTPNPFVVACSKFIYVENLVPHSHLTAEREDTRVIGGAGTSNVSNHSSVSESSKSSEDTEGSEGIDASKRSEGSGSIRTPRDIGETTNDGGFENVHGHRDAKKPENFKDDDFEDAARMLRAAVEASSDHDGWAALSDVGNLMVKRHPDFDTRSYGYNKLIGLVTALDKAFEICRRRPGVGKQLLPYVRER
ncbi:hypothetical protein NHJ13051_009968 [Beauveria bassiana]